MLRTATSDIPRAILLLLVQILVLNQLDLFNGFVLPYLYILVLLLLPFETKKGVQLILGLAVGSIMDVFSNTPGMHISACLVLCFIRPGILRMVSPRDGYEIGTKPVLSDMGWQWYFLYAGAITLVHHLWLFSIEVMRFNLMPSVLLRTLLSSLATIILLFLVQLLFFRTSKK